jgi:hypothetical protein
MTANDDLLLAIGRLEGKVDSILQTMRMHHEELAHLDNRVRVLEQGRSWALGLAAAVSLVFSLAVKFFGKNGA